MTNEQQNKFGDYRPDEHDISNKALRANGTRSQTTSEPLTKDANNTGSATNTNSSARKAAWSSKRTFTIVACAAVIAAFIAFLSNSKDSEPTAEQTPPPPARLVPLEPPLETHPPKTKTGVLNRSQIMFCLAESRRLDSAIEIATPSNKAELNPRINTYNERCLDGQYYVEDMTWAKEQFSLFEDSYKQQGVEIVRNKKNEPTMESFVSVFFTEGRNGGGFGQGVTIDAAKKAAYQSCMKKYPNSKCVERLSGSGRCLAVANNVTGQNVSAGIGDTKAIASDNAIRACRERNQGCSVPEGQSKCDIN